MASGALGVGVFIANSEVVRRAGRSWLDEEALTAAAGGLRVGVLKLEPVPHQPGVKVELRPVEEDVALRVDEELHPLRLKDLIPGALLVDQAHSVGEPCAARALDPDPEADGLPALFLIPGDEL